MKQKILTMLLVLSMILTIPVISVNAATDSVWENFTYRYQSRTDDEKGIIITGCVEECEGELILPESIEGVKVRNIGERAFYGCSKITKVTIPYTESIGKGAFENCTGLEEVAVNAGLLYVKDYAFCGCTSLETIALPDTVNSIESDVFRATAIKEFFMPDSVERLGYSVFEECQNLKTLRMSPKLTFWQSQGLESVEKIIFSGKNLAYSARDLYNLKEIVLEPSCTELKKEGNAVISMDGKQLVLYPAQCPDESFTIPEGVELIRECAFQNAYNLKSVSLPDSLTAIESYAFRGCTSLEKIEFPEGLEGISGCAFLNCPAIKEYHIPKSVSLGGDCIGMDEHFNALPDVVIYGYNNSSAQRYASATGISFVNLNPSDSPLIYTVEDGKALITGCNGFADGKMVITSEVDGYPVYGVKEQAFMIEGGPKELVIEEGVEYIGAYAFLGCSNIESITFPSSLKSVGDSAFETCTGLKSVTFGKNAALGQSMFSGCSSLNTVNLPENLSTIPRSAFESCTALESIVLPDGCTTVDYAAFAGCKKLKEVELNEGLVSVKFNVFDNCPELHELYVPKSVTEFKYTGFGYGGAGKENCMMYVYLNSDAMQYAVSNGIPYAVILDQFVDDNGRGSWSWAADYIYDCVECKLISGYPDGTFLPDKSITRAEFVTILYRTYLASGGEYEELYHPFTDANEKWYQEAIAWSYNYNIVKGSGGNIFQPKDPITRQDMCVILYRYLQAFYEGVEPASISLSKFADAREVSSYAVEAVKYCNANGIINGSPSEDSIKIMPKDAATRAQTAAIFARTFIEE